MSIEHIKYYKSTPELSDTSNQVVPAVLQSVTAFEIVCSIKTREEKW